MALGTKQIIGDEVWTSRDKFGAVDQKRKVGESYRSRSKGVACLGTKSSGQRCKADLAKNFLLLLCTNKDYFQCLQSTLSRRLDFIVVYD